MKLVRWATGFLQKRGIDSPRTTAELLLAHVLGLDRLQLYVRHDQPLVQAELAAFRELIQRRLRREPVAYILGRKGFWTLELQVGPEVLIPRPETELLVEAALARLAQTADGRPARVLDLGTGSGAVVLALACAAPAHRYFASDVSSDALATARRNAQAAGCGGRVAFFAADWLAALRATGAPFELIVSNPPYIARGALAGLQPEIAQHEPPLALDGGADGLDCHRTILRAAGGHLAPGGALLLEIGADQRQPVQTLAERAGSYGDVRCLKDYAGCDRVMVLVKKNIAAH
ncbi:MAG: peptide chain release factor N(5)-glutamine methyltransferase [Desulfobacterales bacterium]|nr:peptide chain release factor N(5)-glutamine methyltransferase [Desulfobacterales bacterium]